LYLVALLVVAAGAGVWLVRRKRPAMSESSFVVTADDAGIAVVAANGERRAVARQASPAADAGPAASLGT
jgi:hypothetical protein